jgi:hypothetical protein
VSAEVAGGFLNLEPLVGAIAGAVAFGDPVGLVQVAGGLAILGGIGLSSLPLIAGRRAEARRVVAAPAVVAPAGAKTSGAGPQVRVLVVVPGSKFGAGTGSGARPGSGTRAGASPRDSRPGGRAADRPPARGRRQVRARTLDSRCGRVAMGLPARGR